MPSVAERATSVRALACLQGRAGRQENPLARLMINLDRGRHVRTVEHYTSLARQSFAQVGGTVVAQAFPPYTYFYMVLSP